jgi:alkylhydroperoxidase family enzyme
MKNRIPPLESPFTSDIADELRAIMPPGVPPIALFRTLAHNPRVLRRVRKGGLLDRGAVSLRDRELVILRTTALCGSEYEWGVHVAFFAGVAGLSAAEVAATVRGDAAALPPADRPLFALCEALHATARVDDALWAELAADRDAAQLIELVALVGQYHGIAFLTNALGVPLEPLGARFPVDLRSTP